MKIVFNGVQVTVAKGTSVNLSNGVIEVNTQSTPTKKTKRTTKATITGSVASACRAAAAKIRKGSEVIIQANENSTIRHAFKSIGMRVSIKTTANATEFRVRKAK